MLLNPKIGRWTETSHPAWLDLLRIGVGIFLFIQGLAFINDIWALQQVLLKINLNWDAFYLAHIIAFTHIIGGFLIAIGLFTRIVIFFQLPILIGAIIFMWPGFDYSTINQQVPLGILYIWSGADKTYLSLEWWTALITFILLLVCWILDSGPWSVDQLLEDYKNS